MRYCAFPEEVAPAFAAVFGDASGLPADERHGTLALAILRYSAHVLVAGKGVSDERPRQNIVENDPPPPETATVSPVCWLVFTPS